MRGIDKTSRQIQEELFRLKKENEALKASIEKEKIGRMQAEAMLTHASEIPEYQTNNMETDFQLALISSLINNITETIIFSLDTNYCYQAFNELHRVEMKKIWNADIRIGTNMLDYISIPEVKEIARQSIDKVLNGESIVEVQHQPDTDIYYEFNWNPIFQKESIIGVTAFLKNITEHKISEKRLLESENKFRKIYEDGPFGMALIGKDLKFLSANNTFCQLVGYCEQELQNLSFANITFKEDLKSDVINIKKLMTGEIPVYKTEKRYIRKDGQIIWGAITVSANFNSNGTFQFNSAILTDITKRKEAEEVISKITERLELATNTAGIGIWDWNIQTNQLIWDKQMFKLYGFDKDSFPEEYEAWLKGLHPDDMSFSHEITQQALRGERKYDTAFRVIWPDKSVHWLKAEGEVFFDEHRIPLRMVGVNFDITTQKMAEQSLRFNEEKFSKTFKSNVSALLVTRLSDGLFIDFNDTYCHIVGYKREELIGKKTTDFNIFINLEDRQKIIQQLQEKGVIQNFESRIRHRSGKLIYVLVSQEIINFSEEKVIVTSMFDISDRKQGEMLIHEKNLEIESQNEEYLQINEELYQTNQELEIAKKNAEEGQETYQMLFESINDAVLISEVNDDGRIGNIIKANDIACQRLGFTQEELLSMTAFDISSEKAKKSIHSKVKSLIESKRAIFESEHVSKDGTIIPVEISTHLTNFRGKTLIHSIIRDITERKQAENKIKETLKEVKRFRDTLDHVSSYVYIKDLRSRYVYANKPTLNLFGCSEEDLQKIDDFNYFPSDIAKYLQEIDQKVFSGEDSTEEIEFHDKTGKRRVFLEIKTPIFSDPDKKAISGLLGISTDITDRIQIEDDLNKNKALLDAALISMTDAISISNEKGEFIEFNEPFATLHRFNNKNDCLKKLTEFADILDVYNLNGELVPLKDWSVSRALRGEKCRNEEFYLYRKDIGENWFASYSSSPICDKKGEILGAVLVGRDITERKQMDLLLQEKSNEIEAQNEEYKQINEELYKAKDLAEQSDRLKTAFLQNMSHEIRTPMNAIMGFAELLNNNLNNREKLTKYSQIINQRCADLLEIINGLLDIAKIESSQLSLNIEECNIDSLFSELSLLFKELQKKQGKQQIKFNIQTHCDTQSSIIFTDKIKLKQVLINLIGNAFKFTSAGEIKAGCRLNGEGQLMFYVSDTGIGISSDKHNFIFERFAQLEQTPGHLYGGTGLGLSIVKGLIDLLGGKIWLESELGKGTTFYFTLPCEMVGFSDEEKISNDKTIAFNFSKKTILLVEDDPYNADYLKEILEETGINIIHTIYGNEAVQIASSQALDAVLMDIRLPDIDGYTATRKIKKSKPGLFIIAQTAYAAPTDQEEAIEAGCDNYISKPVKRDKLLELLNIYLTKK